MDILDGDVFNIVFALLFILVLFVGLFGGPISGSFVSTESAQKLAHAQLSPDATIGEKTVWFVGFKGCENGEVARFKVLPYIGKDGSLVDNAIICAGWPFKGMTIRYQ